MAEQDLRRLLQEQYDVRGSITRLAGEVDYNYEVETDRGRYLLKICKKDVPVEEVDFQVSILKYLHQQDLHYAMPYVIQTVTGASFTTVKIRGESCLVRLHSWVDGDVLDTVTYRSQGLLRQWGELAGALSRGLSGFDHPGAHRTDAWNPMTCLDHRDYRSFFSSDSEREIADHFWQLFEEKVTPHISSLPHGVNYSDAHDQNIIVDDQGQISGVIDFGDAIYAPIVCELAIACAYAGMRMNDPIEAMKHVVAGYISRWQLSELEVDILYEVICARLLITVSMAAKNLQQHPDNTYLQVSAKPAWELLARLRKVHPDFARYTFRSAVGMMPVPQRSAFDLYYKGNDQRFVSPVPLAGRSIYPIDLSVGSLELGNNVNFDTIARFETTISRIIEDSPGDVAIGGYGEVRPFYSTDAYVTEGNEGPQWRTMHIGTDYWMAEGTEVRCVHDGVVHSIKNNDAHCDYGPTIIIQHEAADDQLFYSLYGHLDTDALGLERGTSVSAGQVIGRIGASTVNGGWPPHLHFQVILDLMGNEGDFPGVCYVSEADVWLSLCPSICQVGGPVFRDRRTDILNARFKSLGRSLSVSYSDPLHMVRGYGQYLYDITGRRYLDTVNNVAHVGHEHPAVVRAITRQSAVLNTNTRYLHDNITSYAEALLGRCAHQLEVLYLVNSGSEANELALRMAKVYSGQSDVIAVEAGYHGNTGACVDVSSYKFDGKGGEGAPMHTTVVPIPDTYRGVHRDIDSAGGLYAQYVSEAIDDLARRGRGVAAFIAESILSCGGQIVLPSGYLASCYAAVRANGGLCIADEVQVGFGRVGSHFWGYELQGVVPDIVVCGKPIGNGHPLGAVITTRAVADAFTNGMEYFNTYGGNPVSCAAGMSVLNVIDAEGLQANAQATGLYLKRKLSDLRSRHEIIGDVRGHGFFLGVELVRDRYTLEPAARETQYVADRMRQLGILMSTDGPLHNVLKIKPPMCFTQHNADDLVSRLDAVLSELSR